MPLQWFTRKNEEQAFSAGDLVKSKPAQRSSAELR
jgi:hypothetical protein